MSRSRRRGILEQTAPQEPADTRRSLRRKQLPSRFPLEDGGDDVGGRAAAERWLCREHLVEDTAKGPDIRALVDDFPPSLFRAHVPGRAYHGAFGRQVERGPDLLFGVGYGLRDAEIQELDKACRGQTNVAWLEIPMDDPPLVSGIEAIGDLRRDVERAVQFERSASQ